MIDTSVLEDFAVSVFTLADQFLNLSIMKMVAAGSSEIFGPI
jgi:hypothetical protein